MYKIALNCCFNFLKIEIENTISETYLKYEMSSGSVLSGIVDFIEKDYTKENYFLFDGKMNLNSFVDEAQLYFYSYLIYKNYSSTPYKLGFLGWTKNEFREISTSNILEKFKEIETNIKDYENYCLFLEKSLNNIQEDYIELKDIIELIEKNSSFTNCKFCSIREICPSVYKSRKKK